MSSRLRPLIVTGMRLVAILTVSSKAWATSTTFANWLCEIDLTAAGAPVPPGGKSSIFTTNSQKLCTGSAPGQNIHIECTGQVPGWMSGNKTYHHFPCQMFKGQCGEAGFVETTTSTLSIDSAGVANLKCNLN